MKPLYYFILFSLFIFSSCSFKSSEYKKLQAENDSLVRAKHNMQDEINGYFSAMNNIEHNIEKIKATQGIISVMPVSNELNPDSLTKINDDLDYINELIRTNKKELDNLRTKIKNSNFKSQVLEKTIARLYATLDEQSSKVALLEQQVAAKDSIISGLGNQVETMGESIENLKSDINKQQDQINQQDETIHTAWYVYGTHKELRKQSIVTSGGLFRPDRVLQSNFNKSYFVRIDIRKTLEIPLYSNRAKILTDHPKSSYTLEKQKGNYVLFITDPNEFWSVSKYLVIETD